MKDILTMGIEAVLRNFRVDIYYKKEEAVNDMKTIIDKHYINRKEIEKRIDDKYKNRIIDYKDLIQNLKDTDNSFEFWSGRLTELEDNLKDLEEMLK